jgi:hypothetical protein
MRWLQFLRRGGSAAVALDLTFDDVIVSAIRS